MKSIKMSSAITSTFLNIVFQMLLSTKPSNASSYSMSYSYDSRTGKQPTFNYNFDPSNTPVTMNMPQPDMNFPQPDLNLPQPDLNFPQPNLPTNVNVQQPQQPSNNANLDHPQLPDKPGNSPSLSVKDAFLQAHNEDRKAVGDPPLSWDDKIAAFAQNWANQRINDCRLVHSNGPYGENIYWASGEFPVASIVQEWANEGKNYDRNSNSCTGGMCEHYTQLMWKDTTRIGCSKVNCNDGGIFAICDYDPRGNYIGSRPY